MKEIKEHICPQCGGTLRVDIKKQMYECPFCGVSFDYDYFREDTVLDLAEDAALKGEVHSAKKAYEFMLTKEPDNFEALRGMSLISLDMTHTEDLCRLPYGRVSYGAANNEINRAIADSKPEEREYFEIMKECVDNGFEYSSARTAAEAEIRELQTDKKEMLNYIIPNEDLGIEKEGYQLTVNPKSFLPTAIGLYLAWFFVALIVFICVHTNPYTPERYVPSTKTQHMQMIGFGTGWNQPSEEEQEETRIRLYNEFVRTHQNDVRNFVVAILLPVLPLACYVLISYLTYKRYLKKTLRLESEIKEHRKKIRSLKGKMKDLRDRNTENVERMMKIEGPLLN